MSKMKSVYETLAATRGTPQIAFQDMTRVGRLFKVVAAVTGITNESEFAAVVAHATDGSARVVPGSTNLQGRLVVAMLAPNRRSRPLDDSFKMVTACTAHDMGGNIWNVVQDGSGKRVIIESADDLDALLADRIAHRNVVANPHEGRALAATASFSDGDLVRYVDPDAGVTNCALAFEVDGELRGLHADGTSRAILPGSVMQSVASARVHEGIAPLVAEMAGTALSGAEYDKVQAYLKKAGILSDEMAERMRSLSNTPAGGRA